MNTTQATQLRVGNLFRFISTDSIEQVADIRTAGIKTPTINNVLITDIEPIPLNEDWLVRLGLKKIPHFTVTNSYTLDIGRNRIVSVGNVGTPNEMIWLCQINDKDKNKIDDLICLRNYDYDGYTPVHTFQNLIHSLTGTELTLTDK